MSQEMLLMIFFILHMLLPDSFGFDNLALGKTASQSSTWPSADTPASKAVDGIISQNWPNLAVTNRENTVWWYVDLKAPRNIHNITIYYRAEIFPEAYRRRFAGFSLYISDASQTSRGGYNCGVNSTYPPVIYPILCMRAGRYVSLYNQMPSSDPSALGVMLELGEVQVYGCSSATVYGTNCNFPCSDKCKDRRCNIMSGNCFLCNNGFQGVRCDQPCSPGKYGEGCNSNCSINCVNPMSCNQVNGACVGGCNPGWKGSKCYQSCEDGKYGQGCSNTCGFCQVPPCNKVSGSCTVCVPGYYPPVCQTQCIAGSYGQDCLQRCSWNCKNNVTCNFDNGHCSGGCADGYTDLFCSSECPTGTYGSGCASQCSHNCKNGAVCHHMNGSCDHGCKDGYYGLQCMACSGNCKDNAACDELTGICSDGCAAGWKTETCSKACSPGEFGENCAFKCGNCRNSTVCNRISGLCEAGCSPGYIGLLCSTVCANGLYGQDCLSNCSGNCLNNEACHFMTGTCDGGCAGGYTGSRCNENCVEGKYGPGCLSSCGYCKGRTMCNKKTGHCEECVEGFKPPLCQTLSQKSSACLDSQLGVGIAIGICISAVLIITAILGRLAFRRCRNATNKPEGTEEPAATYSNDVISADQLNNSAKNDDYQELSQIPDANPQYEVLSPNAK